MPPKNASRAITLRTTHAPVLFVVSGLLGGLSLGIGLWGGSPEKQTLPAPGPLGPATTVSGTVSSAEEERVKDPYARDSFIRPQTGHPGAPKVDIPINQTLLSLAPLWERVLPGPIAVPVETEWVAGIDVSLLSDEKVAELLAAASQMKDVEPFAPGSGANSNERMGEWLGSDRTVVAGTPRAYAALMLVNYGWGLDQWPYLDRMWWHESGWDPQTVDEQQGNNYGEFDPSKTWGIPQANPASKMAAAGDDWMTNPETQIRWGLDYIKRIYGSPQQAWERWRERAATGSYGWY